MPDAARHAQTISRVTRTFLRTALAMLAGSSATFWLLAEFLGRAEHDRAFVFPTAFIASTLLLVAGSFSLRQARQEVCLEHQPQFRGWLLRALACASLFMGVQGYALWAVFPDHPSTADASLGVRPFLLMLALLHAAHFLVASLFVSFVTARAWAQRYDHEYHWGVTVCEWFWHALGIVWLVILGVFGIAFSVA